MRALAPDNSKVLQMAFKVFKYSKYNSLPEKKFFFIYLVVIIIISRISPKSLIPLSRQKKIAYFANPLGGPNTA